MRALLLGDEFKVTSTTFNPLVGRKQLASKSSVPHTIVRTVEDPVSTLLALAKGKKNLTVKSIDPIFGLGDPKSVHSLRHFTTSGPRQPSETISGSTRPWLSEPSMHEILNIV